MFEQEVSIRVEANAKVNLTLEILGKRTDGFHELRSILMPVSLSDTVALTSVNHSNTLSIVADQGINIDKICSADCNLAWRAASLLQARYQIEQGVQIEIVKRIPLCAGLGGGSADAAAVLNGLNRLWNLNLPCEELASIGAELGCDVPALVHGGGVLMEGRGERVSPLFPRGKKDRFEGFWMVIVNPGIMCCTADIYKKWSAGLTTDHTIIHNMISSIRNSDVLSAASELYNGLEGAVYKYYPSVAHASLHLQQMGCLGVLLCGSGSSVFGLVRDKAHGEDICRRLDRKLWHTLARTCPVV